MRKPIIAGNWKMNLNHLEAIAVTQKLAYSIEDKDYDAVEIIVIPPLPILDRSKLWLMVIVLDFYTELKIFQVLMLVHTQVRFQVQC